MMRRNEQEEVFDWFDGDGLLTPLEHRKGLPIGNLTSQWFANWMLNGLDHYITSQLGIGGYVRYCDDFILLHNDRGLLKKTVKQVTGYLGGRRLRLHRRKLFVRPVRAGLTFVGYRIWPTHRLLRKDNIRRFRRRLNWMKKAYAIGEIDWPDVKLRLDSWLGHAQHTDCKRLLRRLSREWKFKRDRTVNVSCFAGGRLEQQCQQLPRGEPQQQQAEQPQQQQRVSGGSALSDYSGAKNVIPAKAGIQTEGEVLSARSDHQARNHAVYGLRERGFGSPGSVPELPSGYDMDGSRIYVVRPGGSGRPFAEIPVRPLLLNSCKAA